MTGVRPGIVTPETVWRKWEHMSLPGRIDSNGEEWWACDPYPTWFRWEGKRLIVKPDQYRGWPDDPPPPTPCSSECRLVHFWSNYCNCQGWCL